ncbi:MAG TPA: carbon-nitrogen hydrolase family protein, partial [bacterium]|nr:carbon-nitrogen hydrolase family protein [bacterium]
DLALFPEMWSTGYLFFDGNNPANIQRWLDSAMDVHDPWIRAFQEEARRLRMAVAVTCLSAGVKQPRNTLFVIDRTGDIVLEYSKVHTCCFADLEGMLEPGELFSAACLDYGPDVVGIGGMICFDREFPESARILMLKGAEIILTPNACTLEKHRIAQFKTRAFENMTGMAMTNYPAPYNNGRSMAVSPEVFNPDESSRDIVIGQCGAGEEILPVRFNLDSIRRYRDREVWGDKYRRVNTYRRLAADVSRSPEVKRIP